MLKWAILESLCIDNTLFEKPFANEWTFIKGGRRRQLDFICIDKAASHFITDAMSTDVLTLGIDHKAVLAELQLPDSMQRRSKPKCRRRQGKGWNPVSPDEYKRAVDNRLVHMKAANNLILSSVEDKCQLIEEAILETAEPCRAPEDCLTSGHTELSEKAKLLIRLRREARRAGNKEQEVDASKLLRKEVRAQLRAFKQERISKILPESKGLQQTAGIRQNGRRALLTSIKDLAGNLQTSTQGIVDACASFYELLYTGRSTNTCALQPLAEPHIEPNAPAEVAKQLKCMKTGKAADGAGINVEMLTQAGKGIHVVIAELFSDITQPNADIPASWCLTRLNVLLKKGDTQMLENYKPISILPILLKLFSRVLYVWTYREVPHTGGFDR